MNDASWRYWLPYCEKVLLDWEKVYRIFTISKTAFFFCRISREGKSNFVEIRFILTKIIFPSIEGSVHHSSKSNEVAELDKDHEFAMNPQPVTRNVSIRERGSRYFKHINLTQLCCNSQPNSSGDVSNMALVSIIYLPVVSQNVYKEY